MRPRLTSARGLAHTMYRRVTIANTPLSNTIQRTPYHLFNIVYIALACPASESERGKGDTTLRSVRISMSRRCDSSFLRAQNCRNLFLLCTGTEEHNGRHALSD